MTTTEQESFYSNLGTRIKTARKNAGLKQDVLASLMSLSRASIVNIEKGRQHPPLHTLWELARILNVTIADLIPNYTQTNPISPEWKKIISDGLKTNKSEVGKVSKERLLEFVGEIQTQKTSQNDQQKN